jgi:hypothetical protein
LADGREAAATVEETAPLSAAAEAGENADPCFSEEETAAAEATFSWDEEEAAATELVVGDSFPSSRSFSTPFR